MNSKLRSVTIDTIWEYLLNIDADSVLANCDFEQVKDGEYGRFKIQESPFEVTVLFWPPASPIIAASWVYPTPNPPNCVYAALGWPVFPTFCAND